MWDLIEEPADLPELHDWLIDSGVDPKVIERLEIVIRDRLWPKLTDRRDPEEGYYWSGVNSDWPGSWRICKSIGLPEVFYDSVSHSETTLNRPLGQTIKYLCTYGIKEE